jgi:allophanate hydrolase
VSPPFSLDLALLRGRYAAGELTPTALIEECWRRCEAHGDPAVWIHRLPRGEVLARARRIEDLGQEGRPLYGVPFAIKDNIDLAGAPTTAACPEFAYVPDDSAPVVARLIEAGAIPIGKTNLDQFATGLVGVRSPYGAPRNPFHPDYIPGGSSSGSAVAVAAGLVAFALGTDTAGSGRVPAAFNNLVGLKPTRGRLSTRGVVPACRSLDCVSVFALTVEDATTVAAIAAGFDPEDPFSRRPPVEDEDSPPEFANRSRDARARLFRFGVPLAKDLEWFGDPHSPALFAAAKIKLEALGGEPVEIDLAPFQAAARMLYEGPWLAERWLAIRSFHARHADAIFPVTRRIIEKGATQSAAEAFASFHELERIRREVEAAWHAIDVLLLPTTATIFTREEIEANPVEFNSRLGIYTNFANLLDCAALAVPAGFREDGLPFGITLFGPAWSDARLAELGAAFHCASAPSLGATGFRMNVSDERTLLVPPEPKPDGDASDLPLVVVGAHLQGQPLNPQITSRGGRLLRSTRTADCYRLYALAGTVPPKPGLRRVKPGEGAEIEVEVWALPPSAWADFVAAIPHPLGIGTLLLSDGTEAKGFICEPSGLEGAEDITRFGGWRAYLKAKAHSA